MTQTPPSNPPSNPPCHHAQRWPVGHRPEIPVVGGERETLTAMLDWHRATFELKCSGVAPRRLSERCLPPSGLSLHGLVRHLAGVERWWFQMQFAQQDVPDLYYSDDDPDQDFGSLDGDVSEAFEVWRGECARSREIVAQSTLDDRGIRFSTGHEVSLRWLLLHMIAEYARHNGHADLLRERLDGATGM